MIRYKEIENNREYYVVFDSRKGEKRWWNLFTRNGFDHVYLVTPLEDSVLLINPTPHEFIIDEWKCDIQYALGLLSKSCTAIIRHTCDNTSNRFTCCFTTCVTQVKYILGLKGIAITPLGLYKLLLKSNAETV